LWEVHADTKPLDIVFRPGGTVAADEFNSFQGFDVQPNAWRGTYKLFRELVDRIMADNQDKEGWLWNCAAYRVQRPDTLMNTVPCFVGVQGSGKSKFSEVMARINAPYSIILQHPERFVGRNNACLEGKLFVMCDDMVLAGREENVEKLRGYTTSPIIDVEDKFKPQSQVENRMWITMSGNRPPVTVGAGERRFAMYWVKDPFDGDQSKRTEHYSKMDAELAAGGLEALMHDLLQHQIPASFDPRSVPRTPYYTALVGEVEDSDPLRQWWRDVLEKGEICGNDREDQVWTKPVGKDALFSNYVAWCQNDGSRSRNSVLSKAEWAKGLGRMLPGGLATKRVTVGKERVHVIVPPGYKECCDHFDALFRVTIDRAPEPVQLRSVM
jgi:phage/plasmid-associated DNA primase